MNIILQKRKLTGTLAGILALCLACGAAVHFLSSAHATQRQLPIYCVQRDQKVCAISFDAAWGNVTMRRLYRREH
ncbi:MAG: hypothetical protein LKK00_03735 [Intestinimonas sp.]|jgi:hypothetical protein|nr:hypothetical protein [Intestinimonas sp.]